MQVLLENNGLVFTFNPYEVAEIRPSIEGDGIVILFKDSRFRVVRPEFTKQVVDLVKQTGNFKLPSEGSGNVDYKFSTRGVNLDNYTSLAFPNLSELQKAKQLLEPSIGKRVTFISNDSGLVLEVRFNDYYNNKEQNLTFIKKVLGEPVD